MIEAEVVSKVLGMVRDSKSRISEKIDHHDQNNELRVNSQSSTFLGEVKTLNQMVKERHILLVQDVKKVREDINLQIRELREDTHREIVSVQQDYVSLNQKVNIICDALT
ncbi:unnamed protein product [Lactuca saligna]|uniref:Uncharacterized protein n=1 Tax=Lactuca saligna TaxID=75948 RepID=A0AA35VBF0_LACSI|nr:unnamed protein product [Lactuca saligna]